MATSFYRGHKITHNPDGWEYIDTGEKTEGSDRKCGNCNGESRKDGHDACVGELPDVMNACCGHGNDEEAYIQFWDKSEIRGLAAVLTIKWMQNNKEEQAQ